MISFSWLSKQKWLTRTLSQATKLKYFYTKANIKVFFNLETFLRSNNYKFTQLLKLGFACGILPNAITDKLQARIVKKISEYSLEIHILFSRPACLFSPSFIADRNSTNHRALFQLFASTWRKRCCYSTARLQGLKDEKHCSVTQSATMLRGFFIGGT